MKKLLFAVFAMLIACLILFTACENQSSDEKPADSKPQKTEESSSEDQSEPENETTGSEESSEESNEETTESEGCEHSLNYVSAVAPTCLYPGNNEYEYCSLCDYTTKVEIPATGHSEVQHDAKAPTCTEEGWEAYVTCENCSYTTFQHLPAQHNYVDDICTECSHHKPSDGLSIGLNAGGSLVHLGDCTDSDIVIPADRYGDPIYGVSGFSNCENVTSIYINEGIVKICDGAFSNCPNLKTVYIPDSVEYIGTEAFRNCPSLETVIIGEGSKCAFIGSNAFRGCSSLTEIRIPDGVTEVPGYAFFNCTSLKSVTFGEESQCTVIGYDSFRNCASLEAVNIPKEVVEIQTYAFDGCTALNTVTFSRYSDCTTIGGHAFKNCSALKSINIPEDVTQIDSETFSGCTSLQSITLPDGLSSIGYNAFYNCSSLSEIIIPDGINSIGDRAFWGCRTLTSVVVPDSVTRIGEGAFGGCISLQSITLPFVGANATYDPKKEVNYLFGYIFGDDRYEEIDSSSQHYFDNDTSSEYTKSYYIPQSLTTVTVRGGSLSYGAFSNCYYITDIKLIGVESIDKRAFYDCRRLVNVEINREVQSIGAESFAKCAALESITMPIVGDRSNAEQNTYYAWIGYLFGKGKYDGSVAKGMEDPATSYAGVYYYLPASLKEIVVNGTSVPQGAFTDCSSIESIRLATGVESIGMGAFNRCSSLTSIELPYSVKTIGWNAFANCTGLESFTIPGQVEFLNGNMFNGCTNLKTVVIPASVTAVDDYNIFPNCTSLETVYFTGTKEQWDSIDFGEASEILSSVEIIYEYVPEY